MHCYTSGYILKTILTNRIDFKIRSHLLIMTLNRKLFNITLMISIQITCNHLYYYIVHMRLPYIATNFHCKSKDTFSIFKFTVNFTYKPLLSVILHCKLSHKMYKIVYLSLNDYMCVVSSALIFLYKLTL